MFSQLILVKKWLGANVMSVLLKKSSQVLSVLHKRLLKLNSVQTIIRIFVSDLFPAIFNAS